MTCPDVGGWPPVSVRDKAALSLTRKWWGRGSWLRLGPRIDVLPSHVTIHFWPLIRGSRECHVRHDMKPCHATLGLNLGGMDIISESGGRKLLVAFLGQEETGRGH
jgi:hypothetical protein